MLRIRSLAASLLIALFSAPVSAESLEQRFAAFVAWWPGTYDNGAQVRAGDTAPVPTRLHVRAVNVPAIRTGCCANGFIALRSMRSAPLRA
jgi:hypothetical protein